MKKNNAITKIFAHRGASGYAPENTLEAFKLAIEQSADGIELDVQLTKDGEVVVVHDETIDRVSDGSGYVKDYTLKELKQFSFDNNIVAYKGVKIPTLLEVLKLIRPTNLILNIELKTGVYWYPGLEEKTVELVKKCGMQDRVIYSSFNHYSVQKIHSLEKEAEVAYLYSDIILDVEGYAKKTGVRGLHPAVYHLKMADFINRYKESGLMIRVWTVNDKADMEEFIKKEMDAIITNYPDVAMKVREELIDDCQEAKAKE